MMRRVVCAVKKLSSSFKFLVYPGGTRVRYPDSLPKSITNRLRATAQSNLPSHLQFFQPFNYRCTYPRMSSLHTLVANWHSTIYHGMFCAANNDERTGDAAKVAIADETGEQELWTMVLLSSQQKYSCLKSLYLTQAICRVVSSIKMLALAPSRSAPCPFQDLYRIRQVWRVREARYLH
jgi:hypothetical protein